VQLDAEHLQIGSAGFCTVFKFEARRGGATTCPNAALLLRVQIKRPLNGRAFDANRPA
jgi:hypothetical protein